ncbi:MAG: hypothetical protein GXO66_09740 [Euryarchaeota archaeon]|nr:hypothetical protein [Euryarchaeota archaeon]
MRCLLLPLLVLLLLPAAAAQVEAKFSYTDVDFYFNAPRDEVSHFEVNLTLRLYNSDNESAAIVSDLKAELRGEAAQRGVQVLLEKSYVRVEPESVSYVRVTFRAPSSLAQGSYDAELSVRGNYTYVTKGGAYLLVHQFYITVNVEHPPPTLEASWDMARWGQLKAGQSFERRLTVREVFGYADAENVTVYLSKTGPVELNYSPHLGDIPAGGSRHMSVEVMVPLRNLEPGDYRVTPRIVSDAGVDVAEAEGANYTIPEPSMTLSTTVVDFGKLTFEAGRDSATRSVVVSEAGGYTPIEGLEVRLEEGEEGWISTAGVDYIPPGGSVSLNLSLLLPPDASLGKKSWVFLLTTRYAGSARLTARATVYFPGLEEAERRLAELKDPRYAGAIDNLKNLIAASKEVTELREIAMVMAVYSGVVSFVDSFSSPENRTLEERVEMLLLTRSSLSRAKAGALSLRDESLRSYAIPAVETLEEAWRGEALAVAEAIQERLRSGADYRSAALDYGRLRTLYALLGEEERSRAYASRQEEMEAAYYGALSEAARLLRESEDEFSAARALTLNLREASFVLSPFRYERVVAHYRNAISLAERAAALLRSAGEAEEAELAERRAAELSRTLRDLERAFALYLALLTAFFLWFVARVTLGLIRWVRDSEVLSEGDVVLGGET